MYLGVGKNGYWKIIFFWDKDDKGRIIEIDCR